MYFYEINEKFFEIAKIFDLKLDNNFSEEDVIKLTRKALETIRKYADVLRFFARMTRSGKWEVVVADDVGSIAWWYNEEVYKNRKICSRSENFFDALMDAIGAILNGGSCFYLGGSSCQYFGCMHPIRDDDETPYIVYNDNHI